MKCWYLLYCKRGEQARARANLENQGVRCYYPEIVQEKIVKGKRTCKCEPLFPNYLFVYFDYEQGPTFTTVRSTRGVIDFIRQGGYPQPLQGDLIYLLRQREQDEAQASPMELLTPGQRVRVKQGQLAGIDAIYQEADGEKRSLMLVTLLNQSVVMSVENKHLDL